MFLSFFQGHADVAHYIPEHRFKLITISLVSLALLVGLLIPSIELIIGFVGSTIGVAICIMFPASCYIKICQKNSTDKLLAQFLLIFGFILMVLGTYANLSAIDEKSSGSFEDNANILKHHDDSNELASLNLSKHLNELPEIIVNNVDLHDVPPLKLESNLKDSPNQFETPPKLPDSKTDEIKYHENPVDELNLIEVAKNPPSVQKSSETLVKLIRLDVANSDNEPANPKIDDLKKSNDINNEAIQKEEQEIAIEKKEQNEDDSQSELKRLEETKKLLQEVKDIKNVLEKQNHETQQLVMQKFDEIVDKVEKIEKVQEEDNKKHEEEKAEKILVGEKKDAVENEIENIPLEKLNEPLDKSLNEQVPVIKNQTANGPIISMLSNKQAKPASANNSQENNDDSKAKLVQHSKEEVDHAPIRDLLNVNSNEETTEQHVINVNDKITSDELLRHKRNAEFSAEDCPKHSLNDKSKSLISESEKTFPAVDLEIVKMMGSGRDLKSVQEK